jgi:hypothetical protein
VAIDLDAACRPVAKPVLKAASRRAAIVTLVGGKLRVCGIAQLVTGKDCDQIDVLSGIGMGGEKGMV